MIRLVRDVVAGAIMLGLAHGAIATETWDMATPYGDRDFHTTNIRAFAEDVEKATSGALKITVHSAGSLVKPSEIRDAVRRGLVPVGEVLMSQNDDENSVFGIDSLPFLATDYDQAGKLWEASRSAVTNRLEEQGLQLLFTVPWPPQGLYANREIRAVNDLAGTKFRVYNASTERIAQRVGAIPTRVGFSEIRPAFSSGRVDVMITSSTTGVNTKIWDYVSYFHHIQAWLPKNMVIVNKKALADLDDDVRKAVLAAAHQAEVRGWAASQAENASKIATLKRNGMTVIKHNATLSEGLAAIGKTMAEVWASRADEAGRAALAAYR